MQGLHCIQSCSVNTPNLLKLLEDAPSPTVHLGKHRIPANVQGYPLVNIGIREVLPRHSRTRQCAATKRVGEGAGLLCDMLVRDSNGHGGQLLPHAEVGCA